MKTRWLIVEDSFAARGKGLLLEPRFVPPQARRGTFEVELVRPGSPSRTATASLEFAHNRGSLPPFAMFRIYEVSAEELPKGTEVWVTSADDAE